MVVFAKTGCALFANLARATQPKFWDRVAENVDGLSKALSPSPAALPFQGQFLAATFTRLEGYWSVTTLERCSTSRGRRHLTIADCCPTSKTNEGATFDNRYRWVCRFDVT